MPHPFSSVAGEIERAKEEAVLNCIWYYDSILRTRGFSDLANEMLAENLKLPGQDDPN